MSNKIILFLHTVKHLNCKTNKRQEKYRAEDLKKECMQVIHTQDKKKKKAEREGNEVERLESGHSINLCTKFGIKLLGRIGSPHNQ